MYVKSQCTFEVCYVSNLTRPSSAPHAPLDAIDGRRYEAPVLSVNPSLQQLVYHWVPSMVRAEAPPHDSDFSQHP